MTYAIASREAPGAVRHGEPYYRHFVGRIYNGLIRCLALPGLQDTQCGFKCFRGAVAEELFQRQTLTGWSFDVEILFIARQLGYKIIELAHPLVLQPAQQNQCGSRFVQDGGGSAHHSAECPARGLHASQCPHLMPPFYPQNLTFPSSRFCGRQGSWGWLELTRLGAVHWRDRWLHAAVILPPEGRLNQSSEGRARFQADDPP